MYLIKLIASIQEEHDSILVEALPDFGGGEAIVRVEGWAASRHAVRKPGCERWPREDGAGKTRFLVPASSILCIERL